MSDIGIESQEKGFTSASMYALYKLATETFGIYYKSGDFEKAGYWGTIASKIYDINNKNGLAQSP